jgi:hypothetical protein
VGAGSSDDSVEEAFPTGSMGERISLDFRDAAFYGRFTGTLRGGRFAEGVPVSGWLRARGFSASYRTGSGARGKVRGTLAGRSLQGTCTERFTETLAGESRTLTTAFSFRLEPCGK